MKTGAGTWLRVAGCAGAAALVCLSAGTGCSPQTEEEQEYFEARREERELQEELDSQMASAADEEELITMVKEAETETEDGEKMVYEIWLERQIGLQGGEILFPDWSVSRKGNNDFEVKFAYSVMSPDALPQKKAYVWNVNKTLELVNEPTELDLNKKGIRNRATIAEQRLRRRRAEAEFSLE